MITTYAPSRGLTVTSRLLLCAGVIVASLMGAMATIVMKEYALGITAYLLAAGLAVWRPRYGLYAVAVMVFMLESDIPNDDLMDIGSKLQEPISSWSPFSVAFLSPLELMLLIVLLATIASAIVEHRRLRANQIVLPPMLFIGLLLLSYGWGISQRGDSHIALWEVRNLFLAASVSLLVPSVLTRREYVHTLMNIICVCTIVLSLEIIYRTIYIRTDDVPIESAYAHDTPVFMGFVVVWLLARLVWPATARERCAALVIPVILYAQMVTERRAGWIGLNIGLILLAIFMFRLRRKWFYLVVLPSLILYVGYLGAFWNASGPLAQPARAVRSINEPEGRDINSNLSRMIETGNLRLNIHAKPLFGVGFGRKYVDYLGEFYLGFWPFWHYLAHNSFLWLWVKMGVVGFVVFLTWTTLGFVRGIQLLKRALSDRSASILAAMVSGIAMVLVFAYVDLGLAVVRPMIFLGLLLGVIGAWGRDAAEAAEKAA